MAVFDMKVDAVFLCCLIPSINYRRPILRTNNPLALATPGTQRKGNFLKEIWRYKEKEVIISCLSFIPKKYSPIFYYFLENGTSILLAVKRNSFVLRPWCRVSQEKKRSKKDFFKDLFHLPDQRPSTQRASLEEASVAFLFSRGQENLITSGGNYL